MSLSNPNSIFGIHSITFYDRDDRAPVSYLRVLGDVSLNLSPEFEDLNGGSQLYAWDSEVKSISSELSLTAREYPLSAMSLLLAGTSTEYTAATSGEVINEANVHGTSVYDATTGISTVEVTAGDTGDLKEGEYVIKATGATTVDVYAMSDSNFTRGTDGAFLDDTLKIATAESISNGGATVLANYGLTFTGGSAVAMTTGDTMRFTVRRPLVTGFKLVVGQSGATFSQYGAIIAGQSMSDGAIQYIDAYKVKAAGMPISFKEKGYSEWQITLKLLFDSAKDGVFEFVRNR